MFKNSIQNTCAFEIMLYFILYIVYNQSPMSMKFKSFPFKFIEYIQYSTYFSITVLLFKISATFAISHNNSKH